MEDPSQKHMDALNRVFQYAMNTADAYIQYKKHTDPTKANKLEVYVDASFKDSEDLRTTLSYLVKMNGGPISWRTQLSKKTVYSPCEGEYSALFEGTAETISIRNLMAEIGYPHTEPTIVYEDNEATKRVAENPRCHHRLKHISLDQHLSRDAVAENVIRIDKIDTADQIADLGTKALAAKLHHHHFDKCLHLVR